MSQLLKVQVQDEEGNIYYIHTSADVVFCEDGATVETKLGQKIDKSSIVQNATTASSEKIPSAAVAKILQEQITELNTKTTWTKFFSGSRAMSDNSTPWNPNLTFASFDIVILDVVMHNHHKLITMYVNHIDNQTFMDSWGYQAQGDAHRIVTLMFGISGRFFKDLSAHMLYGDGYQWVECTSAIYVDAIYGINCMN